MVHDWQRTFVSLSPPAGMRNGADFYLRQGLYYRPKGAIPKTALIANSWIQTGFWCRPKNDVVP